MNISSQEFAGFRHFRMSSTLTANLIGAVNYYLADEALIKNRIAIIRQGDRLNDQLTIDEDTGWFRPLLNDVMREGISIGINDVPISEEVAADIGKQAGLAPEWVTQQNFYITPQNVQGFDPHSDPHMVIAAQLYGRKEWFIYDKVLDNPVYDGETESVASGSEIPEVIASFEVEAGDCFVLPRGVYHSAISLTPASAHLAIGTLGARAVDHVWNMAERALGDSDMRADMTPEEAVEKAREFIAASALAPLKLPRFERADQAVMGTNSKLSFADVLDALPDALSDQESAAVS